MKCPHCEHSFTISFKEYLLSGRGKYSCPSCEIVSILRCSTRFEYPLYLFLMTAFVAVITYLTKASIRLFLGAYEHFSIPLIIIIGILICIPLDYFFYQSRMKLTIIKE